MDSNPPSSTEIHFAEGGTCTYSTDWKGLVRPTTRWARTIIRFSLD